MTASRDRAAEKGRSARDRGRAARRNAAWPPAGSAAEPTAVAELWKCGPGPTPAAVLPVETAAARRAVRDAEIRRRRAEGETVRAIAAALACGVGTVARALR